jgi:hypothetical protein
VRDKEVGILDSAGPRSHGQSNGRPEKSIIRRGKKRYDIALQAKKTIFYVAGKGGR